MMPLMLIMTMTITMLVDENNADADDTHYDIHMTVIMIITALMMIIGMIVLL